MKIKTISRNPEDYTRERSQDIVRAHRNLDPNLHPFEKAREYTRALNATKLERLFSKPFLGALTGHIDGVYSLAKHPTHLTSILSGSADGELRLWNLSSRKTVWSAQAHKGFVKGIAWVPFSQNFVTVGEDKTVKLWDRNEEEPLNIYLSKDVFNGVSHHRSQNIFATASSDIQIWDHSRAEPTQTFTWGAETITTVRFNQTEVSILASAGTDRTITLYDLRTSSPLAKCILALRSNAISWNPMEAFNFAVANEDHNCYIYDMRNLKMAYNILKDHVSAVLDCDYSPTGEEIVTGSYDRSIRIFNAREGHSRDIYHTKRMQRIFCVRYSMDSKYILSGSDDANIRLWRANAWERFGPQSTRERNAIAYNKKLKEKYKHMPEIRRIDKHRNIPKAISTASKTKRIQIESIKRKEDNLRKHSKKGAVPYIPERKKNFVSLQK